MILITGAESHSNYYVVPGLSSMVRSTYVNKFNFRLLENRKPDGNNLLGVPPPSPRYYSTSPRTSTTVLLVDPK